MVRLDKVLETIRRSQPIHAMVTFVSLVYHSYKLKHVINLGAHRLVPFIFLLLLLFGLLRCCISIAG